MDTIPFQGAGLPLSSAGLAQTSGALGVAAPEVWTVLAVETPGCGFLPDRRPVIRFERHIFHRLTNGRYDDGNISDPTPGGYGAGGAHQYERLSQAIALDRAAALQSASWGLGQIMGENSGLAGFADVEGMVAAMVNSEDQQLAAIAAFLTSTKLGGALQNHDWKAFARGYNGPNYAINHYDERLNAEYLKYSTGRLPDLLVRAAQLYLTYLGFSPGGVDGLPGAHTLAALAQFQQRQGLPASAAITDDTLTQLAAALNASAASAGAGGNG